MAVMVCIYFLPLSMPHLPFLSGKAVKPSIAKLAISQWHTWML